MTLPADLVAIQQTIRINSQTRCPVMLITWASPQHDPASFNTAPKLMCFFCVCVLCLGNGKVNSCAAAEGSFTALTGLLEVEPLHFTCISTSDGTRVERDDASMFTGKYEFVFHLTPCILRTLSKLVLFNFSEYFWRDTSSGWPTSGNCWWSFYSPELCGPGGTPVTVSCNGLCRAAAAGAARETTAAAEAAAAGNEPVRHTGLFVLGQL